MIGAGSNGGSKLRPTARRTRVGKVVGQQERTQKTVLAYGETLWDLLPTGSVLGGAPFNFVYRVNSLGDRGLIVSRLGRDEPGRKAWDQIVGFGMDSRFVQWDDEDPTGTVQIAFDENNNPDYYIVPGVAYDNIEVTDALLQVAAEADCICFGTLSQRTPTGRRTLEALLDASGEGLKLLDINLRRDCFTEETVTSSLTRADILKLNEDEARHLDGMFGLSAASVPQFAEAMLRTWSLSHCVITFGERGAFAASSAGQQAYVPGYRVELVDPCGSGDGFTAGFIHRLLRGQPIGQCVALGNALGAMVAAQKGATAPIPPQDVQEFLEGHHERITEAALERFAAV